MYSAIESAEAVVSSSRTTIIHAESTREESVDNTPATLVVQASWSITKENCAAFQKALEEALEVAVEGVIVDLLWVESVDTSGVAVMVAATEKAALLGKILSFQAMNHRTRLAVEAEWERQRQKRFGSRIDRFDTSLERFLEKGRKG